MSQDIVYVPEYQRDADQWDATRKSLFVESVINNLTIPAFFFEVEIANGIERSAVIDGQQRLTTLLQYYQNSFSLVPADDAAYISPNSLHYAGKFFRDLPLQYQQAFRRYRLTTIKLRQIEEYRLEIFRRINQGGTPLSGQDIRLAYYGEGSPSVTFVRLAGIFDEERPAARRSILNAREKYAIEFPWKSPELATWRDWWEDKELAKGQTASEMFLWALVASTPEQLDNLLANSATLAHLKVKYDRTVDSALDAFCAQLRYQDREDAAEPPLLATFGEIRDRFTPHFQQMFQSIAGVYATSTRVTKYRTVATVIGAAYAAEIEAELLVPKDWAKIAKFVNAPSDAAKSVGIDFPQSKGRWDGLRGYKAQLIAVREALKRLLG